MPTEEPRGVVAPTEETRKTMIDYISGKHVPATPEEVEAVQIFSKRLVEDYGYAKEQIQTRPQFRVRSSPSDEQKKYPVDIAVFASNQRDEENLFMIVECKEPTKKTGLRQLKNYMEHSPATIGVWFNGKEHAYIRKVVEAGTVDYPELPNIPRKGQRLEDIGQFKRRDLKPTNNLKAVFKDIRNQLAGSMTGITRDQELAPQIIILLFCKIYDELNRPPEEIVSFRAGIGESAEDVFKRIDSLFEDEVKEEYDDVFDVNDHITLDEKSVLYVVGELQNYCIIEAERDVISDAFQVFIGPALTGPEGQFFTPRNVIRLIIALAEPQPKDYVIDPACGSGGFLINALERVWQIVEAEGKKKSWSATQIEKRKARLASKYFRGIDKDAFLAKVTKAYMALVGDGRGGIFCDNSLEVVGNWKEKTRDKVKLRSFSLLLTNPPFGKKLRIDDPQILSQYELGHRWTHDRESSEWAKTNELHDSQPPQILFIERCLDLLKDRGTLGIVLPESLFCNPSHRYIIEFLLSKARIKAIASMPEELFQPYTHAKTAIVVIQKGAQDESVDHDIFMGIARWCGHDSRGLAIPYDDIPKIQGRYQRYRSTGRIEYDHLGFTIKQSQITDNIYLPKYYNPEIAKELKTLRQTHRLVSFSKLVKQGLIAVSTGDEVGKLSYGTGKIPFIRTSDISNWEIKIDPKHGLSEEIYSQYANRQDVKANDILMVRDGTYLVGTCAIVTKYDTKMVYQSHIYKIRSLDHAKLNPFFLLAILSSPIVKKQIFSKRFTQDIIDTLGNRLYELVLPIPKSRQLLNEVIRNVKKVINTRSRSRELARKTVLDVAPTSTKIIEIEEEFLELDETTNEEP